jgi:hypothetical protein
MKTTIVRISAALLAAFAGLSIAQQGSAPRPRPGVTTAQPAPAAPQSEQTTQRPPLAECSNVHPEQRAQCEDLRRAQLECQSARDFQGCVRSKM